MSWCFLWKKNSENVKNGNGLDFNSLFANKDVEDLISNVTRDKLQKELADMVKNLMWSMEDSERNKWSYRYLLITLSSYLFKPRL